MRQDFGEKENLLKILHGTGMYFLPVSVNGDWDRTFALPVNRMCGTINAEPCSFCCAYSCADGPVWSICVTFAEPVKASEFRFSPCTEGPHTEDGFVRTLEIYVRETEILDLRRTVFQDDTSEFWKHAESAEYTDTPVPLPEHSTF